LSVWSLITVTDGAMRVWHFNGVITTYGKRDCRNSWRYASLAVNRGAIKRSFTVHTLYIYLWNKSFFENHLINLCSITVQKLIVKHDAHNANSLMNISFNLGMMSFLGNTTVVSFIVIWIYLRMLVPNTISTSDDVWRVSYVEQGLISHPEHPSSLPGFSRVNVARSLVFCVMFYI
jgi:hypothetical protein